MLPVTPALRLSDAYQKMDKADAAVGADDGAAGKADPAG